MKWPACEGFVKKSAAADDIQNVLEADWQRLEKQHYVIKGGAKDVMCGMWRPFSFCQVRRCCKAAFQQTAAREFFTLWVIATSASSPQNIYLEQVCAPCWGIYNLGGSSSYSSSARELFSLIQVRHNMGNMGGLGRFDDKCRAKGLAPISASANVQVKKGQNLIQGVLKNM